HVQRIRSGDHKRGPQDERNETSPSDRRRRGERSESCRDRNETRDARLRERKERSPQLATSLTRSYPGGGRSSHFAHGPKALALPSGVAVRANVGVPLAFRALFVPSAGNLGGLGRGDALRRVAVVPETLFEILD